MITPKEEENIRVLSDNELYPQAVEFMHGIARPLPSTQVNGLLNVSLAHTYDQLQEFVTFQQKRSTWKDSEQHIREFYRRLTLKFLDLQGYALTILASRMPKASKADEQEMKMAVAREFIQHLLAENDYMIGTQVFQSIDSKGHRASNQERSHDGQQGLQSNRGTRQ